MENVQPGLLCQQGFLAHPFGSPKLQIRSAAGGHAVLGFGEIGHWSEQLGDMARISDGHTRTIELLAQSLSQPSISSRNASIRSQRMLCVPVLGTEHMLSTHILPLLETLDSAE